MVMAVVLFVGATAAGVALAQTSDSFDIGWNVLGGGGGGSGSESFAADGTVGQPATGTSASASLQLDAGFWPGVAAAGQAGGETPTPAATPTPTATPVSTIFGDVDCDGDVDSVDAQKELRHVAVLPVSQTEPCPDIGSEVASQFGDVDCDDDVDSVDSLKILRFVAGLSVSQQPGCPLIGV
jgi:hypothetical protein